MAQANKVSKSQKVRNMIAKGHDVAYIAKTLGVKPQMVYNIRWRLNKKSGLGAIAPTVIVPPATPEQLYTESQDSKPRKVGGTEAKQSFIGRLVSFFRGW